MKTQIEIAELIMTAINALTIEGKESEKLIKAKAEAMGEYDKNVAIAALEQAWRLCLKQWRWIASEIKKGSKKGVESLKAEWCEKHFPDVYIAANCFFCAYDKQGVWACDNCPACEVDKTFDCRNLAYHYRLEPLLFYKRLLKLNKIRESKL